MGTDIHLYVEKRNPKTKKWEVVKGTNPRISFYRELSEAAKNNGELERAEGYTNLATSMEKNELVKAKIEKLDEQYPLEKRQRNDALETEYLLHLSEIIDYDGAESYTDWVYDGRNYDLFAILADVRNGYGFAGCDTGDGFKPISKPRGLPSDISSFVQGKNEVWDGDGHSHSHFTVKELVEYNWEQTTNHRGFVGRTGFSEWKENGYPTSYSGGVNGSGIVHITNHEMEQLMDGRFKENPNASYYTAIEWKETYKDSVGTFYTHALESLKELAGDQLEDVRIVFWFDN